MRRPQRRAVGFSCVAGNGTHERCKSEGGFGFPLAVRPSDSEAISIGGIAVINAEPAKVWAAVILGEFMADDLTMPDVSTRIRYGDALIPDISTKITYGDPVDSPNPRK
jgi:hypothetical protein